MNILKRILFFCFDLVMASVLIGSILNQRIMIDTAPFLYSSIENLPYNEYGLVLGTSKNGKYGLNPYFTRRMDAAVLLYQENKIDKIIVSGDNHIASYNETQDMTDYLLDRGIPSSAIIQDYAGYRTLDSVVRAKLVFGCDSITIISQSFHNQRAVYIAQANEIHAIAYNAEDVNSKTNYTHLREFFAKTWVFIDLYLFHTQPKFL